MQLGALLRSIRISHHSIFVKEIAELTLMQINNGA